MPCSYLTRCHQVIRKPFMAHLEQHDALCPQGHDYAESTGWRRQTSDYCTLPLNNDHLWAWMTSLRCRNAKGLGAVLEYRLLLKDTSAYRLQRREIKLSTFITLEQLLQPLSSLSFSHNNFIKMPNNKTTHVIIFFTIGHFFYLLLWFQSFCNVQNKCT